MTDLTVVSTNGHVEPRATVGPWALLTGDKGPAGTPLPMPSTSLATFQPVDLVRRFCGPFNTPGDYANFSFQYGWQNYGSGHLLVQCSRDAQGRCILQGLAYCNSTSAGTIIFIMPWDMTPMVGGYARMCHMTNTTGAVTRWDSYSSGSGGNADAAEMNWLQGGSFTNGYWVQFDSIFQTFMPQSWVDYGCQNTATSTVAGFVDYVVTPGRVSSLNIGGRPLTIDIPRTTIRLPYRVLANGSYYFYFWYDMALQQFGHTTYPIYNNPLGQGGSDVSLHVRYDPAVWMQLAAQGRVTLAFWGTVYSSGVFDPTQYQDRRFLIRGPLD